LCQLPPSRLHRLVGGIFVLECRVEIVDALLADRGFIHPFFRRRAGRRITALVARCGVPPGEVQIALDAADEPVADRADHSDPWHLAPP